MSVRGGDGGSFGGGGASSIYAGAAPSGGLSRNGKGGIGGGGSGAFCGPDNIPSAYGNWQAGGSGICIILYI